MSALDFLASGGMASTGGDMAEADTTSADSIAGQFSEKLRAYARRIPLPASALAVQQCSFLFVGKDVSNFHFIFANGSGGTKLVHNDIAHNGKVPLDALVQQITIEIGDVVWAFSCPFNLRESALEGFLDNLAIQYVESVVAAQKPEKGMSAPTAPPEIAAGIASFRKDYPEGTKTAFIVMQFEDTQAHSEIAECLKVTLKAHGIVGLRADDKDYMDDLFPNVKVFIHACDFGIAVFDRITENDFNPNVTLEVGYMMGLGKSVLLLKDKTLPSLSTDLTGKLYKNFDTRKVTDTIPVQVERWLTDKGIK